MERELALEIVRVTELGALASASWIGRGDKDAADDAATTAIRSMFDSVSIDGTVVIGEGEMDDAPMLYIGEKVGNKRGPLVDVAVDPLEGTEVVAAGLQNAQSVIAIADKGSLLHAPDIYMQKLACGPELAGKLSLEDPVEITLTKASHHLGKSLSEMTVMVLDRDRHKELINTLRQAGVRIQLLSHGDVAGAIAAALPDSDVDLYLGSGGAPEGVLAAAALKCLGGEMQGQLLPQGRSSSSAACGWASPIRRACCTWTIWSARATSFCRHRGNFRRISERRPLHRERTRRDAFRHHAGAKPDDPLHPKHPLPSGQGNSASFAGKKSRFFITAFPHPTRPCPSA